MRNNGNKGWSIQAWDLDNNANKAISNWATNMRIYFYENVQLIDNNKVTISMLSNMNKDKSDDSWYIETSIGEIYVQTSINEFNR